MMAQVNSKMITMMKEVQNSFYSKLFQNQTNTVNNIVTKNKISNVQDSTNENLTDLQLINSIANEIVED